MRSSVQVTKKTCAVKQPLKAISSTYGGVRRSQSMAHAEAGGSLPVPNVQALAQTYIGSDGQIPERYIRGEEGAEKVIIAGHDISSAIPVIDLSRLLDPQSSKEECAKLGSACEQWGFFQLINHGVPDDVISSFRNDMAEFFRQPLEAKKVYSILPGNLEGYGQLFVVSDNQKLDWADMFYLMLRPKDSRDMRFWPSSPPSFRSSLNSESQVCATKSNSIHHFILFFSFLNQSSKLLNLGRHSLDRYSSEAAKVVSCLLRFLAMDMGIEPESLQDMFGGQPQSLRMTYYPPCKEANKVVGLSPHTDASGLTLLLQVNEVQGLQIRKDGKWIAVNALNGAFIINCGEILEILSNGRYKSIEHRAMVHPTKERMSAAIFHQPRKDVTVGPLPELVKNDGGARYNSISYMDFIKGFFAAKLDGRDHLESLKN